MSPSGKCGQVVLYLAFAILALAFVVLFHADLYFIISSKNRLQNAGDAATLAAARGQGASLNAIGRLNLERIALALGEGTEAERRAKMADKDDEQAEETMMGPLRALADADRVARNDYRIAPDPDLGEILRETAETMLEMAAGESDRDIFDAERVRRWAQALVTQSSSVCVGPDNIDLPCFNGSYLPYKKAFYEAVGGRDWCWFHFYAMSVLEGYRTYADWGVPPERIGVQSLENSPVFSLGLVSRRTALTDVLPPADIAQMLERHGFGTYDAQAIATNRILVSSDVRWWFYDTSKWGRWTAMDPAGGFPVRGTVKPEYDVNGASAVCRVKTKRNTWVAAARPFGTEEGTDGSKTVTSCGQLVLPSFTDVRLIPVGAASGGSDTADVSWVHHIRHHVPTYLASGPQAGSCSWCANLRQWERAGFRATGVTWLKFHSGTCRRPGHGGGTGGTRYAH